MSNATRKTRRAKRPYVGRKERGPCVDNKCGNNGSIGQACELCAQKGKTYKVLACPNHAGLARAKLKRHILLKHPGTIPSAMLAALSGRDMT